MSPISPISAIFLIFTISNIALISCREEITKSHKNPGSGTGRGVENDLINENELGDVGDMMVGNHDNELDYACPGLDYLGVGYDSIYANTLGTDDSMLDPGYRAPVIEFTWRKNSTGYSPTLGSLYPVGGWVRPVFSCSRTSKINEIETLEDFKNALSANAKLTGDVPSNAFSGSIAYKNAVSNLKTKKQRIYNKSDQCIRYQVGIPLNIPWRYTEAFIDTIKSLPIIKESDLNSCNIQEIKTSTERECNSLNMWIKFFEMFGTHFTHQLTLGGRIIQTVKFDAERLDKLKKNGLDIELVISSQFGSMDGSVNIKGNNQKTRTDDIGFKKISVIGGNMPSFPLSNAEFASWGKSVERTPMPVGLVASSIKQLLDNSLHNSFDISLLSYAGLNGISYEDLKAINGHNNGFEEEGELDEVSLEMNGSVRCVIWIGSIHSFRDHLNSQFEWIRNSTNVLSWSYGSTKCACPKRQSILFGLAFLFNKDMKLVGLMSCQSKLNTCKIPQYKPAQHMFYWLICTSGLQPNVHQVSNLSDGNEKNISVKCPDSTSIEFGIIITFNTRGITSVIPCENGKSSCSTNVKSENKAAIWVLCYTQKIKRVNVKVGVTTDGLKLECNKGELIISGGRIYIPMKNNTGITKDVCDKFTSECSLQCNGYKQCVIFLLCQNLSNYHI